MILYLDTSALLKKYFKEVGSTEVISRWKEAAGIVTCSVAYAEIMASIYRKKRELSINDNIFRTVISSFQGDWNSFICVGVTEELNEMIDKILATHPLRGFDAIHLASALTVRERIPEDFLFACFDRRLIKVAQMESLNTLPAKIE
jgi:predicted nucleic acid-binding protein